MNAILTHEVVCLAEMDVFRHPISLKWMKNMEFNGG